MLLLVMALTTYNTASCQEVCENAHLLSMMFRLNTLFRNLGPADYPRAFDECIL